MNIGLILKIGGIGVLVACINQILLKSGKDDIAPLVSLSGIIVILFMLIDKVDTLFKLVRSVFGI